MSDGFDVFESRSQNLKILRLIDSVELSANHLKIYFLKVKDCHALECLILWDEIHPDYENKQCLLG